MTVPELIARLPLMGEWFPREIQQDWSLEEWDRRMRAVERRVMAALDKWREENQSAKKENDHCA
jgi:hypothetical protein